MGMPVRLRVAAAVAALGLAAAGCGGGDGGEEAGGGSAGVEIGASPSAPVSEGAAGATPSGPGTGPPAAAGTGSGVPAGSLGAAAPDGAAAGGAVKPASLFKPGEDRIGISDDKITMCLHAALVFAEAFDTRVSDFDVYWRMVNAEQNGVHGRRVEMFYADDRYGAVGGAADAFEECREKRPFILHGGFGFDQIPEVRPLAEQHRIPYIHHIAREDLTKRFSFSYLPTVETAGRLSGEWILRAHRGKKIGVVWRQSDQWEPGHETFLGALARGGVRPVVDLPVQNGQTVYKDQIDALRAKGAQVVFVWENALAGTEIVKQAKQQDYNPRWFMFAFNLMTDTLKEEALSPPMQGIATWPAYVPGASGGSFARYAGEIERFEAAQRKYGDPRSRPNDLLWLTWLGWKQIHRLLLDCGRDCTRNRVVGLLQSGAHEAVHPLCPIDFTRNGHVGGSAATVFEAFKVGDGAGWKEISVCKTSF